jgi:hypothetical protein
MCFSLVGLGQQAMHVVVHWLRGTRSIVEEDATNKLTRVFVPYNNYNNIDKSIYIYIYIIIDKSICIENYHFRCGSVVPWLLGHVWLLGFSLLGVALYMSKHQYHGPTTLLGPPLIYLVPPNVRYFLEWSLIESFSNQIWIYLVKKYRL